MVMTTNRGWRSRRQVEKSASGGHALSPDDVAELSGVRDEPRDPLVLVKVDRLVIERRPS
jgi:hypothetical protein